MIENVESILIANNIPYEKMPLNPKDASSYSVEVDAKYIDQVNQLLADYNTVKTGHVVNPLVDYMTTFASKRKDFKIEREEKMYDKMQKCRDLKCDYYYGEINQCMVGEPGVSTDMERKCATNKLYNCPDCERTDTCDNCQRVANQHVLTVSSSPLESKLWGIGAINPRSIPPACVGCGNHPSTGGSGICHCVLGSVTIY